jgi:hypothetical protein
MNTPMSCGHFYAASVNLEQKSEILVSTFDSRGKDITPINSCAVTISSDGEVVFDGEIELLITLIKGERK